MTHMEFIFSLVTVSISINVILYLSINALDKKESRDLSYVFDNRIHCEIIVGKKKNFIYEYWSVGTLIKKHSIFPTNIITALTF